MAYCSYDRYAAIPIRVSDTDGIYRLYPGGTGAYKKKAPEACGLRGLDRGRLPTFPLSQYHRRGKV